MCQRFAKLFNHLTAKATSVDFGYQHVAQSEHRSFRLRVTVRYRLIYSMVPTAETLTLLGTCSSKTLKPFGWHVLAYSVGLAINRLSRHKDGYLLVTAFLSLIPFVL